MSRDRAILRGRPASKTPSARQRSICDNVPSSTESRLTALEVQVEHISHDVCSLKGDTKDVRERAIRIEERVSHLPSFLQMVSMLAALLALIAALTLYQDNLKRAFGAMSSSAPADASAKRSMALH